MDLQIDLASLAASLTQLPNDDDRQEVEADMQHVYW